MDSLFFKLTADKQLRRSMKLLEFLYLTDNVVSIDDLSFQLDISRKTVIMDIEILMKKLPEGITIAREKRVGVRLLHDKDFSIENYIANLAKETVAYKILISIFQGNKKNIGDWVKELFTSNTVLRENLKYFNRALKPFHLGLSTSTVELIGNEVDIRYFYYVFFKEFRDLYVIQNDNNEYGELYTQMISRLNDAHIPALRLGYFQITLWLMIAKERLISKNYVTLNPELVEKISKRKTYSLFKQIFEQMLKENFQIYDLPQDEGVWAYITALHCIEYKPAENTSLVLMREEESDTFNRFQLFLEDVIEKFNIDNSKYKDFIYVHQSFLVNMNLLSQQTQLFQRCTLQLKKYIKATHPNTYGKWLNILKRTGPKQLFPIYFIEDLCVMLTMLTTTFKFEQSTKINHILLSFRGDPCYINYLETITKMLIPDTIKCTYISDSLIVQEVIDKLKVDLFVSNYNDNIPIANCRLLHLSYIPTIQEWTVLKNYILVLDIMK